MRNLIGASANIASGTTLSAQVGVRHGDGSLGVWVPVVTSCQAFIQAAVDTTSANFFRVQNPAGSGDFTLAVGAGSKFHTLPAAFATMPYLRFELSVAQTTPVSLNVLTRV